MPIEKLDHLSILEITGDDALTFLQGQLTNDINLANNEWQYSGYCSPKGRLLGLFTLWQANNCVYTIIDSSLVEAVVKRLRMYVMRSKVAINITDKAIYGISDKQTLTNVNFETNVKPERYSITTTEKASVLSYGEHYLMVAHQDIEIDSAATVDKHSSAWHALNIKQGLPEVTSESVELFIPQMLNLDILNGINFKKGCYTGQEIIARMHYLGKLKQRMFVCDVNIPNTKIRPGDKIFSDQSLSKSCGNIVSINNNKALAILRLESTEQETTPTLWLDDNSSLTTQETQPYELKASSK